MNTYRLLPLALSMTMLASCTLSMKYDLPESPIGDTTIELVDASGSILDGAVTYASFRFTDDGWYDYLGASATLKYPNGVETTSTMSPWLDSESYGASFYDCGESIYQGVFRFTVVGFDDSLTETFDKSCQIGTGSASDPDLGVRYPTLYSADGYAARAPYICDSEPAYEVAISDDKSKIYVKPLDSESASLGLSIVFTSYSSKYRSSFRELNSYSTYLCVVPTGVMQAGKWIELSDDYYAPVNASYDYLSANNTTTVANVRKWSFFAWASDPETKAWGKEVRTFVSFGAVAASAPSGDIIVASAVSRGGASEPSPHSPLLAALLGQAEPARAE